MPAFSVGNSVTLRGSTTAPVMDVVSIDNALGRIVTVWAVAGLVQTGTFDQESLQISGISPAISIAAPVGLRAATDPWAPGQF